MGIDMRPEHREAQRRIDELLQELDCLVTLARYEADDDDGETAAPAQAAKVLTGWVLAVEWKVLDTEHDDDNWTGVMASAGAGRAFKIGCGHMIIESYV